MRPLTSTELRSTYLAFFRGHDHVVIPSASLVPADDPTVLFTTAGMHPLVPYLLGAPHPAGRRLVDVQKCVRTGDIDAIGDDTHLTFFEMLGNWSLGDYFRDEAIGWSWELLTSDRWLGVPPERLAVTCLDGDHASVRRWRGLGVSPERIAVLGRDDNWWGPAGNTGPCGPDTEIFYWIDPSPPGGFDPRDRRWVEIWNDVFMGYTRTPSGTDEPLPRPNVDTGMGLERMLVALGGLGSVYDVDTVAPLHRELRALAPAAPEPALRVMTDHLRAVCFMIADGVQPSNKDRGYVVRRLVRRMLALAHRHGLPDGWLERGVARVGDMLGEPYPEVVRERSTIAETLHAEHGKLARVIAQGHKALRGVARLDGKVAFDLFQTHGLPFEITLELAEELGTTIDRDDFAAALAQHQAASRTTASGTFAGGLADHSDEIVRYHTLTHLLHAALRQVLGGHVIQRGSNITRERLRFDFSHDRKLAPDELARVEELIASWLARELVVEHAMLPEPIARSLGAIGAFGEKYGDVVSVYTISDRATGEVISRELCGGPHVAAVPRGRLRIVREQPLGSGVRRIRAVLDSPA